jgi:hypothetical protein
VVPRAAFGVAYGISLRRSDKTKSTEAKQLDDGIGDTFVLVGARFSVDRRMPGVGVQAGLLRTVRLLGAAVRFRRGSVRFLLLRSPDQKRGKSQGFGTVSYGNLSKSSASWLRALI